MINITICNNDLIQLNQLKYMIDEECSFKHHISCFYDENKLLEYSLQNKINVLIIDLVLNNKTGIEVARTVLNNNADTIIIFTSEYDEFLEDVYDVEHTYLLIKPIKRYKLKMAVYKAYNECIKLADRYIHIRGKNSIINIDVTKVLYFESLNRNTIIKFEDSEKCIKYTKINDVYNMIDKTYKPLFMHCHQSFIVNLSKILEINKNKIKFENNMEIPVSRKYQKEVLKEYVKVYT